MGELGESGETARPRGKGEREEGERGGRERVR